MTSCVSEISQESNRTPLDAATVVMILIAAVSSVAVPCVVPAAETAEFTSPLIALAAPAHRRRVSFLVGFGAISHAESPINIRFKAI